MNISPSVKVILLILTYINLLDLHYLVVEAGRTQP